MDGKNSIADDLLRNGYERWERLEGEKQAISDDLKELFAELKGHGFDGKALRAAYRKFAKMDDTDVQEHDAVVDLYVGSLMGPRVGTVPATRSRAAREAVPATREERSKARLSEAMDDNKALSAEMLADGLISEEAHAENVALSDAVATKLGAGVVDPVAALRADPAMAIVDVANLKKSEPQPTQAAEQHHGDHDASDLTSAPQGQVAPNPVANVEEDANGAIVVASADPASREVDDADRQQVVASGLTGEREPGSAKPVAAAQDRAPLYPEPGVITWEDHPPEGVERHEYSTAFGAIGQDIAVIEDDLVGAKAEPIVKIGKVILDGWARYMKARSMIGLDGKPIEYPVVQYDGRDPLVDCIKWNLAGRILTDDQKRTIAQRLVKIYPQRKGIIFAEFGLGMELVA